MRNQRRQTLVVNKTKARISIIKPKSSTNTFFPQSQSKSLGKSAKTEVCKSRPSPHSCINSPFPCHTLVMESWRLQRKNCQKIVPQKSNSRPVSELFIWRYIAKRSKCPRVNHCRQVCIWEEEITIVHFPFYKIYPC